MVWRWNFPFGLLFRGKSNVSLRENCKTDQSFESLDVSTCDNSDADLNTTDSTLLLLSAQVSELADDALAKHGSRGKWGPHTRVTWCFQSGCFLVGKTQNSKSPIPSSNDVRKKKLHMFAKKNSTLLAVDSRKGMESTGELCKTGLPFWALDDSRQWWSCISGTNTRVQVIKRYEYFETDFCWQKLKYQAWDSLHVPGSINSLYSWWLSHP